MAYTRDSLTLPRMNAQRLVIIAAALTTLVAATLSATFAVFSGVSLPRAVRANLTRASGTALVVSGQAGPGQIGAYTALLRQQIHAALAGTPFTFDAALWSDPLGFTGGPGPSPPAGAGGNTPIAEAAALGGITAHAVLVSGRWPGTVRAGQPVPAALPATSAALLHARAGDELRLRDRVSGRLVLFRVTGLYRPRQLTGPAAGYRGLDDVSATGSATSGGFTTYGPLTVPPAAFAGPLTVSSGSWVAQPDMARIPDGRFSQVAANVSGLAQSLSQSSTLSSLALTTGLPAVLDGTRSDLSVARSLLVICAILVALLAAAALLVVARLLTGQREGESAMLAARGATRGQLTGLALAEAAPVCVAAAAAGGLLGCWLAGRRAGPGPVPLGAAAGAAWPAAAIVAAGAMTIMMVPVLQTPSPGAARARRGRQAAIAGITRAGTDVALVLLAVLAGWELRRYSAVPAGAAGGAGVDPVLVAAPGLALVGGAIVVLRLLPAAGRAGDALAARGRRLTAAFASWQISRQPVRQGGAALLVVLAVGTATLALAQRQSWTRSDHDQASFTAGADVRVQSPGPLTAGQAGAVSRLPGVRHAMPVAVFPANTAGGETLALDASHAAAVALLRPDQSPLPGARLFGRIRPVGPDPGIMLPGRPAQISLTARIGPASLPLAPVVVSVTAEDADGDAYQLTAGTLPADGAQRTLTASLPGGSAIYPLRLTAITASYTLPATSTAVPAVLSVDHLSGGPGTAPVPGSVLAAWQARASSPELSGVRVTFPGTSGPSGLPAVTSGGPPAGTARTVTFDPGYGQAASGLPGVPPLPVTGQLTLNAVRPVPAAIPGIATRSFLAASNAAAGSTVQTQIGGVTVNVVIVAAVGSFPTVGPGTDALIVDLATIQDILASQSVAPAGPAQWWLASASGQPPPGLAARLPAGSTVTTAAGLAAGLLNDPVSAVPQHALLAVALAAALLAITGFCVSIAAGVRQRRAENALLAALGVPPGAAARQLALEQLMLSVPSALAGLALGAVLAELLVPAITLTTSATAPVPPVLIEFGWQQTVALAAAVAIIPVLAAALAMARRPDPAAALRAGEAA
jgi:FtsX-like permease family